LLDLFEDSTKLRDSLRSGTLCVIVDQRFADRVLDSRLQLLDDLYRKLDVGSDGLYARPGVACRVDVEIESLTDLYAQTNKSDDGGREAEFGHKILVIGFRRLVRNAFSVEKVGKAQIMYGCGGAELQGCMHG